MIILKCNFVRASILHHTTDTDNMFVKLETLLNNAFNEVKD